MCRFNKLIVELQYYLIYGITNLDRTLNKAIIFKCLLHDSEVIDVLICEET